MEKLSILEVIEEIIEAVDEHFPGACSPNITLHHVFENSALSVSRRLQTKEGAEAQETFYERLHKIQQALPKQDKDLAKDLEDFVLGWMISEETLPLATGYAAGLRFAGLSKESTKVVLRAYLRNFVEPPELNQIAS